MLCSASRQLNYRRVGQAWSYSWPVWVSSAYMNTMTKQTTLCVNNTQTHVNYACGTVLSLPAASCERSTAPDGRTVINCTILSEFVVGVTWVYTFPAVGGSTPGDYVASVALVQPDTNPDNDKDDAPINLFAPLDVAVNIAATPGSVLVGSNFTYTVNM